MEKFKDKCHKQLHIVGGKATSFKRKLTTTKSLTTSTDLVRGCEDQDLDHLLENTDQVGCTYIFRLFLLIY